jgi:hypothetical protein
LAVRGDKVVNDVKPGDPIPTAEDVRVTANTTRRAITLLFKTPVTPVGVEVPIDLLPAVLVPIGQALSGWPETDVRALAQLFAIREVSARLHGHSPTLAYELEMGLHFQASIDLEDARRLHRELGAMLDHLADQAQRHH